ncbi:PTS sugar transporter subunit IIA [Brevibacillus sp. B_LB10_24]|uniref:PTS sugar transporter subunit IIA n=1 Tax=Brevibacillus sp. B_LB10_24 TaxID=3380645 RepID=UPI0038BA6E67
MVNRGIILISHGWMAVETLKSAEMILGPKENAAAIAMEATDSPESTKQKLQEELAKFSHCEEVIVLADLMGGTPCNVSLTLLGDHPNMQLFTGFNLPLVMELLASDFAPIDEIRDNLVESGRAAVTDIRKKLQV